MSVSTHFFSYGASGGAASPVETSFTYGQISAGWTLLTDAGATAGRLYVTASSNQDRAAMWCGFIRGSEAYVKLDSDFGDDATTASLYRISVDGGAAANTTARLAGKEYQLFTGLPDTWHFVTIQTNPANANAGYAFQPTSGNVMRVIGTAPSVLPAGEWSMPAGTGSKGISSNGLIPTMTIAGRYAGTRNPLSRLSYNTTVNSITYTKMGRMGIQGFQAIKTSSTEIWVVSQSRYAFIYDGSTIREVDTTNVAGIGGNNVRVARFTGLASGSKTLLVYTSAGNDPTGNWFSVGVPNGQTFEVISPTIPQVHLWGDSITQGTDPRGATYTEANSGRVDTIRSFWDQGYIPGNFGIAGTAFPDFKATTGTYDIALQLPRLSITSNDVAYFALGQNGTPVQADVEALINALVAQAYRKVIVRGVLPLYNDAGDAVTAAKNATIQAAITAVGSAKVAYINPSSWSDVRVNTSGIRTDGIHFEPGGYDLLKAHMDSALPTALA